MGQSRDSMGSSPWDSYSHSRDSYGTQTPIPGTQLVLAMGRDSHTPGTLTLVLPKLPLRRHPGTPTHTLIASPLPGLVITYSPHIEKICHRSPKCCGTRHDPKTPWESSRSTPGTCATVPLPWNSPRTRPMPHHDGGVTPQTRSLCHAKDPAHKIKKFIFGIHWHDTFKSPESHGTRTSLSGLS
jgi:hypothetical protein